MDKSGQIRVQVNGKPLDVDTGVSVAGLIDHLSLQDRRLAVELNMEIVPKSRYEAVCLKDNDVIEVVHAIGGG